MTFEKFQANREKTRGVGKVEPKLVSPERRARVDPEIARVEGALRAGGFTDDELRQYREMRDNPVGGALYSSLSVPLWKLRKRAESILEPSNSPTPAPDPIPRNVTERQLLAAGVTTDEIQRRREIEQRSGVGQAAALVMNESLRRRIKDALSRAGEFESTRARFETEEDFDDFVNRIFVERETAYHGAPLYKRAARWILRSKGPKKNDFVTAGKALWEGDKRAPFKIAEIAHNMHKRIISTRNPDFDPWADKNPTTTP